MARPGRRTFCCAVCWCYPSYGNILQGRKPNLADHLYLVALVIDLCVSSFFYRIRNGSDHLSLRTTLAAFNSVVLAHVNKRTEYGVRSFFTQQWIFRSLSGYFQILPAEVRRILEVQKIDFTHAGNEFALEVQGPSSSYNMARGFAGNWPGSMLGEHDIHTTDL